MAAERTSANIQTTRVGHTKGSAIATIATYTVGLDFISIHHKPQNNQSMPINYRA